MQCYMCQSFCDPSHFSIYVMAGVKDLYEVIYCDGAIWVETQASVCGGFCWFWFFLKLILPRACLQSELLCDTGGEEV